MKTVQSNFHTIIDCDPSADDAIALMLAANSPELHLEGITTVSGVCEAADCAEHARQVLRLCGRTDVPVYIGARQPLKRTLEFDGAYCGADGLSETQLPPSGISDSGKTAADFLADIFGGKWSSSEETVQISPSVCKAAETSQKKQENQETQSEQGVHIISIAPMTNLARLLLDFPEAAVSIASIITINGSYGVAPDKHRWNPRPSWNVCADPEAAKLVLESGVPVIAAGLDVTMQLQNSLVERLLRDGDREKWQYRFLERAIRFNRLHGLEPYSLLVDAMAVAAAVRPELLSVIRGKAAVCTDDGLFCGQTLFGTIGYLSKSESDVSAAYTFDFEGYAELLLERVFG